VPMADVGPYPIPDDLHLDDAVLLTDALPTGYQAAEMGDIQEGDTVVVFGAGPIGIFAAKSAWLMGAGRVIVVDEVEYRLEFVKRYAQCEVVNFREVNDMAEHIKKMTDWMGADVCTCPPLTEVSNRAIRGDTRRSAAPSPLHRGDDT